MAGSAFDLDQFAPEDVTFKLGGVEYRLNGNPDVDVVAQMLRVEQEIGEAETADETVKAVQEGKRLIVKLMLDVKIDQNIDALDLNVQQVLTLFALVVHGSSVAAIVASAISQPHEDGDDGENEVSTAHSGVGEDVEEVEGDPLVSESTSHERSSASGDIADGLLVTGTA